MRYGCGRVVTLGTLHQFAHVAFVDPQVALEVCHACELVGAYGARIAVLSQVTLDVTNNLGLTKRLVATVDD